MTALSHNQTEATGRRVSLEVEEFLGRLLVQIKWFAFTGFGEDSRMRIFYIPETLDHLVRGIHRSNAWYVDCAWEEGDKAPRLHLLIIKVFPKRRRRRFIDVHHPFAEAMPSTARDFGDADDIDISQLPLPPCGLWPAERHIII